MKVNSSTIKLEKEPFEELKQVVERIASKNEIKNVKDVGIRLTREAGIIKFAIIDDWAEYDEEGEEILYTQESEEVDADSSDYGSYIIDVIYNVVTPESAESGEYEHSGYVVEDAHASDIDDLVNQLERHGFSQDNDSRALDRLSFDTVDPERDYQSGEDTYYTVFINREDGKDFEQAEADEIKSRLGIQ